MIFRKRPSVNLSASLLLAVLAIGCDEGSGPQRVYFSVAPFEGCVETSIWIDTDPSAAMPVLREDGTPECELSPGFAERCTLSTWYSSERNEMYVGVDDCSVPSEAKLFSCLFHDADLEFLNYQYVTFCACLSEPDACYLHSHCDVCASSDPEGANCEKCSNREDDDGDGMVDCADEDCESHENCFDGRTTLTCPTSTWTTTTISPSTTFPSTTTTLVPMSPILSEPAKEMTLLRE